MALKTKTVQVSQNSFAGSRDTGYAAAGGNVSPNTLTAWAYWLIHHGTVTPRPLSIT
jgi:hypothetical protein